MAGANSSGALWVRLEDGTVGKVKTVGCEDMDDFAEAIKKKFSNERGEILFLGFY